MIDKLADADVPDDERPRRRLRDLPAGQDRRACRCGRGAAGRARRAWGRGHDAGAGLSRDGEGSVGPARPSRRSTTCSAAPATLLAGESRRARPLRPRCAASLRPPGQPLCRTRRHGLAGQRDPLRRACPSSRRRSRAGGVPGFAPDIVHAHDWQAALAPAYLHYSAMARGPRTVITIHNLAFQGQFPTSLLPELRLPPYALSVSGVEYYGMIGFLKAGLLFADRITTVSPRYAAEIKTAEAGMGLEGLLSRTPRGPVRHRQRHRRGRVGPRHRQAAGRHLRPRGRSASALANRVRPGGSGSASTRTIRRCSAWSAG